MRNLVFTFASISLLAGCATTMHRGIVAMKINENEAHVGIGSNEVAVGDHVELYRNECESTGEKPSRRACKKVLYGHGEVKEILNADYSVVKFPEGIKFSEGDTIERHIH